MTGAANPLNGSEPGMSQTSGSATAPPATIETITAVHHVRAFQ